MLYAGVVGSVGIWEKLGEYATSIAPESSEIVRWILIILANIASLGGVAVLFGGFLLTTDRVGTGKFIIGIAAGLGIFGFIMFIYNMYMAQVSFLAIFNLIATSASLLGPILTIFARLMTKKPE